MNLHAAGVTLGYDRRIVSEGLDVEIPDESFTAIIGPNACGKSTLLRALARLLRPREGHVLLDGADIARLGTKELARRVGLLPQSALAPSGITVSGLVGRGRFPHTGLLRQWSASDSRAVDRALAATGLDGLGDRLVDELSGGQRQRVWIAMALAQETPVLLLDEPTTFLDIAHQIEVLDLFRRLHADGGRTLVAVLHDLNQAARYADHVVAMRDGRVVASGPPAQVVTEDIVRAVFGLDCRVIDDPESHTPLVVPRASPAPAPDPSTDESDMWTTAPRHMP